jgi:hypothetical protein
MLAVPNAIQPDPKAWLYFILKNCIFKFIVQVYVEYRYINVQRLWEYKSCELC